MKAIKRAMSGGLVTVGALATWQLATTQTISPTFFGAAVVMVALCFM